MILIFICAVTVLLVATLVAGGGFWVSEPSRILKGVFGVLAGIGLVAAVWCTFGVEYQPKPTLRIQGVPLPVMVLQLQNGEWVDFVGGPGLLVDLLAVPSIVALPASLPLIVRGIRRRRLARRIGFPVIFRKQGTGSSADRVGETGASGPQGRRW